MRNIYFLKMKQQLEEKQRHLVLFIHLNFCCVFCTSYFSGPGTESPREATRGRRDFLACSLGDTVHHGRGRHVALSTAAGMGAGNFSRLGGSGHRA